jgi:NhaA family Na+:H+ antiporter
MKQKSIFKNFFKNEKSGGIVLIFVTLLSLLLANSPFKTIYSGFWEQSWAGLKLEHWINDGLMSIFFLLIGLEIKRELIEGELSSLKKASLPVISALGGMLIPALLYVSFNSNSTTLNGFGIPMATDIAFALGVLSLIGNRVPTALKVFLAALAIIDDLGAIIIIALFYSSTISIVYLGLSLLIFILLLVLNKLKVNSLIFYIIGGIGMWYFMNLSGVHATITGFLVALTIPLRSNEKHSPANILQKNLHFPVPFIILPLFAMANTAIELTSNWQINLFENYSVGIFFGLVIGKPLGIILFTWIAVKSRISHLPSGVKWSHIIGAACLGGIGFTMSIFVTLLAFNDEAMINSAKLIILISSIIAGFIGFFWLKIALKK